MKRITYCTYNRDPSTGWKILGEITVKLLLRSKIRAWVDQKTLYKSDILCIQPLILFFTGYI